jgi:hypothetical protein
MDPSIAADLTSLFAFYSRPWFIAGNRDELKHIPFSSSINNVTAFIPRIKDLLLAQEGGTL